MKRFCLSFILFLGVTISWADNSDNRQKIILDTDMVELFDDGIAMMMLAKAPNIDLLGVTVVAGNTWVSEGTAYAIRQLEAIGITDIPVLQGIRLPFAPNRVENMKKKSSCLVSAKGIQAHLLMKNQPSGRMFTPPVTSKSPPSGQPTCMLSILLSNK